MADGSPANVFVKRLVSEQRGRLIATLMRVLETECFPTMAPAKRKATRERVYAAVGQHHDMLLDIIKASVDDGTVAVNEDALLVLRDLNLSLGKLVTAVEDARG